MKGLLVNHQSAIKTAVDHGKLNMTISKKLAIFGIFSRNSSEIKIKRCEKFNSFYCNS